MGKLAQLLIVIASVQMSQAQTIRPQLDQDPVFTTILSRQISYPFGAARAGIYANVYTAFRVDSKGRIQDVTVLNPVKVEAGLAKEVVRNVKRLPSFNPNYEGLYVLPVSFGIISHVDSIHVIRSSGQLPAFFYTDRILLTELSVIADPMVYQSNQVVLPAKAKGQSFILNP